MKVIVTVNLIILATVSLLMIAVVIMIMIIKRNKKKKECIKIQKAIFKSDLSRYDMSQAQIFLTSFRNRPIFCNFTAQYFSTLSQPNPQKVNLYRHLTSISMSFNIKTHHTLPDTLHK